MTKRAAQERSWKAWAIVDGGGRLMARDYRLPLTWSRKNAVEDRNDYTNGRGIIVRATVTLDRSRRRKGGGG